MNIKYPQYLCYTHKMMKSIHFKIYSQMFSKKEKGKIQICLAKGLMDLTVKDLGPNHFDKCLSMTNYNHL